jgi:hypothetical protein
LGCFDGTLTMSVQIADDDGSLHTATTLEVWMG